MKNVCEKEIIVADLYKHNENPLAELVNIACTHESDAYAESDNRRINLKSIMGILAFKWDKGMKVTIRTEGADEEEALDTIEKFLQYQ